MKKVLVSVLGLVFLGVAGVLVWKVAMPNGQPANAPTVATDIFVTPMKLQVTAGQATVTRAGTAPIKVTTDLEVKQGDAVKTDTNAKATLAWSDGSVTRLGGNTDITLTKASMDANGAEQGDVEVRSGEVWTKVLNVAHDDTSMQVRAQNTVAGIRGTSVYTAVSATGIVMLPMEHGIDVTVDGTNKTLLEGEGMIIKGAAMTMTATGSLMNGFITESVNADKTYVAQVAKDRRAKFEATMSGTTMLPDFDTFSQNFRNQQGTTDEKSHQLGSVMDELVREMLAAQDAKDTVRMATLTDYYNGLVPLLADAGQSDAKLRNLLRLRVQMHMALLFSAGVTDDTFLARQAIAKARMALTDQNNQTELRHVLRKEMFFAADLANQGKARQVEEVMTDLRDMDAFKKPLMETATPAEKDMFERVSDRMEAAMPSMTDGVQSLRHQLYSVQTQTNVNDNTNAAANENMNTLPQAEETNANTNARRTNANINAAVKTNANTNAAKKPATTNTNTNTAVKVTTPPATTTTKTETTTTTTATTVTLKPATLVPAPVRTSTTTTTRPVLTPAK